MNGGKFHFLDEFLGEYIISGDNISMNSHKCRKNYGKLLHDHVYLIQRFEPNKDKLWNQIRFRLSVLDFKREIKIGNFGLGIKMLSGAFVSSPIGGGKYFLSWTKRKFQSFNTNFSDFESFLVANDQRSVNSTNLDEL